MTLEEKFNCDFILKIKISRFNTYIMIYLKKKIYIYIYIYIFLPNFHFDSKFWTCELFSAEK